MKSTRTYTMWLASRERRGDAGADRSRGDGAVLERAFEDVTLAAIASAAGVSHQTVLNHFESKEGVVLAVAEILARGHDVGPLRGRAR